MAARWLVSPARAVAVAGLVLVSGCGDENKTTTGGGTPSSSPTGASQSSPTQQPAAPLTKAQLTAALLTAEDLPAGYKTSPSGEDDTDALSGDAGCRKMAAIDLAMGKGARPGEAAYADVSFELANGAGGSDESLASFSTQEAAMKEFSGYVAAADSCRSLGMKVDPTSSATITLAGKPLSLPTVGDESRAYRYQGTVQGTPFWLDGMVFRVGSTVSFVSAGGVGAPQSGLLGQIATKAAVKLK